MYYIVNKCHAVECYLYVKKNITAVSQNLFSLTDKAV